MAYSSGTATSVIDLLTKIKDFLVANSWTLDDWLNLTTGNAGKEAHIHNGSNFIHMRTCNDHSPFSGTTAFAGLAICGSTSYDNSKVDILWAKSPGFPPNSDYPLEPVGGVVRPLSGSMSYHIFTIGASDESFICAIEYSSGKWKFIAAGTITKMGTWTGGKWFAGTDNSYTDDAELENSFLRHSMQKSTIFYSANAFIYITSGPDGTGWYGNGVHNEDTTSTSYSKRGHPNGVCTHEEFTGASSWSRAARSLAFEHYKYGYNTATGRRPFSTIPWTVFDGVASYSVIGYVDGLRVVNMTNMSPTDEIVLGDDTWMVFPNNTKVSGLSLDHDNVGLLILKVV